MARTAANDGPRDNRESLALWVSQRHGAMGDYRRVLNERENDLLALSESDGPRSVAYQTAMRTLHDRQVDYQQIQKVVRRPLNRLSVRWQYFAAFVLALALLEAPVNKYLFDVALQGSNIVSYCVSIAVAFFLLTIAHLAGKCLRQIWSDHRRKIIWSNVLMFLVSFAVIGVVVSILTIGRASTSAEASVAGFSDLFSTAVSKIGTLGLWGTLANAFSDLSALILATVNIGGVFVAMLLAYFSHDPDKDFDIAALAVDRSRVAVTKMQAAYLKRRKRIIERFKPDLTGISATHGSASKAVIELKTLIGMPLDEDDSFVVDELDRLAEDSDHAEETGAIDHVPQTEKPTLREFPRKAS